MYYLVTHFVIYQLIFTYAAAVGSPETTTSGYDQVQWRVDDIEKSDGDANLYRGLVLGNGLTALLVSDPDTDLSAASLSVAVGSLSDPKDLPGLAHFCEHMLFLGTNKYPKENDFTLFLSQNSGSYNAHTYTDYTNYYFSIKNDSLTPALDRFAQFFLEPLFTISATEREIKSVNSEHEKKIANDICRIEQLERSTADPNHPYNRFTTGTKETLWDIPNSRNINVCDELLKFHSKWYSSNLMYLTVLGKDDLDTLEALVVSLFGDIEQKYVDMPYWNDPIFTEEQLATKTVLVPVMDVRALTVSFLIPDQAENYKSMPYRYLSALIEHEGPTSILAVLKKRGWCNKLSASNRYIARGIELFEIGVDLTEEGVNRVNKIIKLIFQYVNMLKREGLQEWFHNENQSISEMEFQFQEKSSPLSYVIWLSSRLITFKLEDVLTADYLIREWRPDLILDLLSYFRPDNIRVTVVSKEFENKTDSVEKYYGTQYSIRKISSKTISYWQKDDLCEDLQMPLKNNFIATNFSLVPIDENIQEHPVIIYETHNLRCWFKTDKEFRTPKAFVSVDFSNRIVMTDPFNLNIMSLFVSLFDEDFSEYKWDATRANLYLDVTTHSYGFKIQLGGFNHKLRILLEIAINKLMSFKIDPIRFEIHKEKRIKSLKNIAMEQPDESAKRFNGIILSELAWTPMELLAVIDDVNVEDIEQFIKKFFSRTFMEALMYGNIDISRAAKFIQILENPFLGRMGSRKLLPRQLFVSREVQLEDGEDVLYETTNEYHTNSCAYIHFQVGVYSTLHFMILRLFQEIIDESCFNTLRTQEQLGYDVYTATIRRNGVMNLRIVVQSEHSPMYVDSRIENYITTIEDLLISMSDEDFVKYKDALAVKWSEKPKGLMMQAAEYQYEIDIQEYNFGRDQIEVGELETIVKNDIIQFYQDYIRWSGPKRHKLAIHVQSTLNNTIEDETPFNEALIITDIKDFKKEHRMYPFPTPFISV